MEFTIRPDGTIEAIYNDDLAPIMALGPTTITRASNVEPWGGGGWFADMSPSGGPTLFANGTPLDSDAGDEPIGFATRAEALAAEVAWLKKERGL